MHAAVLVLLSGHEGVNFLLVHLLSCGCIRIDVKARGLNFKDSAKQAISVRFYIWGLTQGGQHDAQLSAHDCAIALLVEDTQTLNVVVVGSLGVGIDLLQHGQESVEVEPLVGHLCSFTGTHTRLSEREKD